MEATSWRVKYVEQARAIDRRKRCKDFGVPYHYYTTQEVFERDGWVCQICSTKVDEGLSRRDRWGATIDHIVPLSRGGFDIYENAQLAHRICNVKKGRNTMTSLYLIDDPQGTTHVFNLGTRNCSCEKANCYAAHSASHSFASDCIDGFANYTYDSLGNVFNAEGHLMVNLGVDSQGVIFDDDGMC